MRTLGWRRFTLRKRVLFNLDNGDAIAGLVWHVAGGPVFSLRDAELYARSTRSAVAMDGEVIIDGANVVHAQVLAPMSQPTPTNTTSED